MVKIVFTDSGSITGREVMERYGCFEVRTTCSSCGSPIVVNGPYRLITCPSCFKQTDISDTMAGFLNDFEEEYEGFDNGQGQGGTLMGGSGTFQYGYWRLAPRCSSCKTDLNIPEDGEASSVKCTKCGREHFVSPVPEWLKHEVPSATLIVASQPVSDAGESILKLDDESLKPIVMTCPQCSGALTVSTGSERILNCSYCNTEVYVPDAIWRKLHPVNKTVEWFVGFAGKNSAQLQSARRAQDTREEKKFLRGWKMRSVPSRASKKYKPVLITVVVLAVVFSAAVLVMVALGYSSSIISKVLSPYAVYAVIAAAVLLPVGGVLKSVFMGVAGKGKLCKQAMTRLAEKHGWKHSGTEYRSTVGYINAKYRGHDIEIDPSDDYAIEIDLDDSPFYLNTEVPGYPQDGVQRFTTGDSSFDNLFPIRYATPELAERIQKSPQEAAVVLAPIYWFVNRWEGKLWKLKIDWRDVGVHLISGSSGFMDTGSGYLPPEDLEPLLEDMIVLAAGIEAVAAGKQFEPPE